MTPHSLIRCVAAGLCAAGLMSVGAAQASTVNLTKVLSNPTSIPGLTTFATTGAMMSGLSVTATFSGGFSQTLMWGTTGAASGGVTGAGWGLSVDGDTFTAPWQFVFAAGTQLGQLVSLVLDGTSALTVFDTTNPDTGTPDSAQGNDFEFDVGCDGCTVNAVYDHVVGIGADAPVTDLFQRLTLNFVNGTGPRQSFSFLQDTDNDSRFGVPEPGAFALAGLALAAAAATTRRRRA